MQKALLAVKSTEQWSLKLLLLGLASLRLLSLGGGSLGLSLLRSLLLLLSRGSGGCLILLFVSREHLLLLLGLSVFPPLAGLLDFRSASVSLVSQHLGPGLLGLLLVDMLHEDTLVLESVTLGLQGGSGILGTLAFTETSVPM